MKRTKSLIATLVVSLFMVSGVSSSLVYAESAFNYKESTNISITDNQKIYYSNDTKIVVNESENIVKVDVYVDDILDHSSEFNRLTGNMVETLSNGDVNVKNVEDFITIVEEENSNSEVTPYANLSGYSYLTSGSGFTVNPSLTGYLWYKDTVEEGTKNMIRFSAGTKVGAITGFLVGLIPGINAVSVITGLGGAIAGGVIGSAIDGEMWAIDEYRLFKGVCNGTVSFTTSRFTRYSKVINKKNGKVDREYVGKYGNWNENSELLYQTVSNYHFNYGK